MHIRSDNRGYTIIEVLVFIVVSGFLLLSALLLFNGRQQQIQYEQGVRDMDFKIQDAINSVSNGYFPKAGYECVNDGSASDDPLSISPDTEDQGTSDDCVFAGKAIERVSGPGGDTSFKITTILAAKPEHIGTPMSLGEEDARLTAFVATSETIPTSWGLKINEIVDASGNEIDAMLFLSELGTASESSGQIMGSGTQSINLYTPDDPDSMNGSTRIDPTPTRPVFICLESQDGSKNAAITLGEDGRELTTSVNQDVRPGDSTLCDV